MAATDSILTGTYRIVHRDNNDNTIAELLEKHTDEFAGTAAGVARVDPQQMPKVKKALSTVLKQDDKLVIMFKPSVADVENAAPEETQNIRLPVTFRNVRSGVVYEKTLTYSDFVEIRATGVAAQIWALNTWYDMISYTIPAQSEMKLGHAVQDVRVDSALNILETFLT